MITQIDISVVIVFILFWENGEHVHPLPARGEDELGVNNQTTIEVANTAAGSGLHDADCSPSYFSVTEFTKAAKSS